MNRLILLLITSAMCICSMAAQDAVSFTPEEQEIVDLSNSKWQWMSDKNVDRLKDLFHDSAQFVHMGGYWGKEAELNTIKDGGIWYKKAEIHKQEVRFAGPTATVYSTIHLNSVVGGHEVRFPFYVTETYLMDNGQWKLISLVFTKTLGE